MSTTPDAKIPKVVQLEINAVASSTLLLDPDIKAESITPPDDAVELQITLVVSRELAENIEKRIEKISEIAIFTEVESVDDADESGCKSDDEFQAFGLTTKLFGKKKRRGKICFPTGAGQWICIP